MSVAIFADAMSVLKRIHVAGINVDGKFSCTCRLAAVASASRLGTAKLSGFTLYSHHVLILAHSQVDIEERFSCQQRTIDSTLAFLCTQ